MWLGGGLLVVALLITAAIIVPRITQNDPCETALQAASDLGLQLSDDDEAVSCEWQSRFTDSGGLIVIRTESPATRESLLIRSGMGEEIAGRSVSIDDGPFRPERWRSNLDRDEQVYLSTGPNGHQLKIIYNDEVEGGLLLTVVVSPM